jgi:hypothetical protein
MVASPAPWNIHYPDGLPGDSSGTQALGTTNIYDVDPNTISSLCGAGQKSVELSFPKTDTLTAFSLKFTFGCGQCSLAVH